MICIRTRLSVTLCTQTASFAPRQRYVQHSRCRLRPESTGSRDLECFDSSPPSTYPQPRRGCSLWTQYTQPTHSLCLSVTSGISDSGYGRVCPSRSCIPITKPRSRKHLERVFFAVVGTKLTITGEVSCSQRSSRLSATYREFSV